MIRAIAHRGASRDRPENTVAAFDEALRQGCDGIELDVQLSADGVPVVYHDRTLFRAGGGRRRVAALPWSELKRLGPGPRAGDPSSALKIPSLAQVLGRYAGRTELLVEIKPREARTNPERHRLLAEEVARALAALPAGKPVHILSFDTVALDECRRVAAEVPRVLNWKATESIPGSLRHRLPTLQALSIDVRTLTPRIAAALGRAGLPLFVFTCNTPARVRLAVECGAAAIMSDRPGWLVEQLRRTGTPP